MAELKGNFSRIYTWKLLGGGYALGSATLIAYFRDAGVTLPLLFTFQAFLAILLGLLEVPTGLFADAFGRKTALTTGAALLSSGVLCTASAPHTVGLLGGQVLIGVGSVFMSGADMGLLQSTLIATGRVKEGTEVLGRAHAYSAIAMAVFPLIGAMLATVSYRLSWIVASFLVIPAALNLFLVREPKVSDRAPSMQTLLQEVPGTIGELKRSSRLRGLLLFWALLLGVAQASYWLYQPYLESRDLVLPLFGVVYGVLAGGSGIAATQARRWRGGATWRLKLLAVAALSIGTLLPPFLPVGVGVLCFCVHQLVSTALSVVLGGELFLEVEECYAATLFSLGSLISQVICSVFLVLLGMLVQMKYDLSSAFLLLGLVSITLLILGVRIGRKNSM